MVIFYIVSFFIGSLFSYYENQNINQQLALNCATQVERKDTIEDFFPYKANIHLIYMATGTENPRKEVYIDYIKDKKMQTRELDGATVGRVYEKQNGELTLLNSVEEFYYRESFPLNQNMPREVLIKEPIQRGTTWQVKDNVKREITAIGQEIATAAGNFTAIEVTTTGKDYTQRDYYGKNFGLVKSVRKAGNIEVITAINKIELASELEQRIKLYYPLVGQEKIQCLSEDVKFKTNDKMELYFEKVFRMSSDEKLMPLIGKATKINSISLNRKERKICVDFSKELLEDLKSEKKQQILQAMVNTLGSYYNLDKVSISVEGKELLVTSRQ